MNAPCFKAIWFEEELSFQPFFWKTQVVVCVLGQSSISMCHILWKGADFLSNLNLHSAVFQTLLKHWSQQRAILVNQKQHQQSDSSLLSGFKRVVLVLLSVFFKPCSSIQVNPKQHQQSDRSLLSEHCSVSSLPSILLFHTHPLILQPECKCMLDKQNS